MSEGPDIGNIAALIGERGRAEILTALMAGQALTATELTDAAGITRPTASAHLARLLKAKLIVVERQGRHRYFRIFDHRIAYLLETLTGLANTISPVDVGPRDPELRKARVCYDHLAGELGVFVMHRLQETKLLLTRNSALHLSQAGTRLFESLGVDVQTLNAQRRPLCRACLDWSERRHHLAGALGAAFFDRIVELRWATRVKHSRIVRFTARGERELRKLFDRDAGSAHDAQHRNGQHNQSISRDIDT